MPPLWIYTSGKKMNDVPFSKKTNDEKASAKLAWHRSQIPMAESTVTEENRVHRNSTRMACNKPAVPCNGWFAIDQRKCHSNVLPMCRKLKIAVFCNFLFVKHFWIICSILSIESGTTMFIAATDHNPAHSQKDDNAKDVHNHRREHRIPGVHQCWLLQQEIPENADENAEASNTQKNIKKPNGSIKSAKKRKIFQIPQCHAYLCHHGLPSSPTNGCWANSESGSGCCCPPAPMPNAVGCICFGKLNGWLALCCHKTLS